MISLSTIERVARALAKANNEDADLLVSEQRSLIVTRKGHSIVSGVVPLWHSYMDDAIAVCQEIDERPLEWDGKPTSGSTTMGPTHFGGVADPDIAGAESGGGPPSWWEANGLYPPIDP